MNWISVKDKLPNHSDFSNDNSCCEHDVVLLWISEPQGAPRGLISLGRWQRDGWEVLDGANLGGYMDVGFFEFDPKDVSHWMRLPDAPKE